MKKVRLMELKRKPYEAILGQDAAEMIEDFHRIGQEKLHQEALEAEVDAHLYRSWYQPKETPPMGYRNGYYRRWLIVPGSSLEVAIPRCAILASRSRVDC